MFVTVVAVATTGEGSRTDTGGVLLPLWLTAIAAAVKTLRAETGERLSSGLESGAGTPSKSWFRGRRAGA